VFDLLKFSLMPVGSPRERKNLSQAKVIAQLGTTSYRLACLRTTRALWALAISYSQVVNTVCKTPVKTWSTSGSRYTAHSFRWSLSLSLDAVPVEMRIDGIAKINHVIHFSEFGGT